MPRPSSRTVHGAVRIERDGDLFRIARERLVDRVVDDLVDHVVEAGAVIGVADVHARTLAHGIEALEDLDRFGAIVRTVAGRRDGQLIVGFAGGFSHERRARIVCGNDQASAISVTRIGDVVQR